MMRVLATLNDVPKGAALRAERRPDESPVECRTRLRKLALRKAIIEAGDLDDVKLILAQIVDWMP
jgi:hypothetical protein